MTIFILLSFLGQQVARAALEIGNITGQNCISQEINVVSFVNPDSEIGTIKKSLDDVQSLAVLANDPRAALPESFTICSDIMSVFSTKETRLTFFTFQGNNGDQLLSAVMYGQMLFTTRPASGQISTIFPNQWIRSCMAINTVSGMIQWVVEGELVENNTIVMDYKRPKNLKGKIILGAYQMPTKSWWVFSNKLTNLNIFSGLLSLPVLQRRTKGDEVCLGEGDYMAWSEMQWDLRGGATSEMIRPEELKTRPMVNLYGPRFPIKDCQRFCKHLGTQMTSVSNTQKLGRLLIFCDEKMHRILMNKKLNHGKKGVNDG